MPRIFRRELPRLFELDPDGSLWYVAVDHSLVARLSIMRIRLQLTLTPDVSYGADETERIQYFGMHTTTSGSNFGNTLDHVMLAIPPAMWASIWVCSRTRSRSCSASSRICVCTAWPDSVPASSAHQQRPGHPRHQVPRQEHGNPTARIAAVVVDYPPERRLQLRRRPDELHPRRRHP